MQTETNAKQSILVQRAIAIFEPDPNRRAMMMLRNDVDQLKQQVKVLRGIIDTLLNRAVE